MATYTTKQLGIGALSATLTTTLYTVPAATTTVLTSVLVTNTNTTTARKVTIKGGPTTKRAVMIKSLEPEESFAFQVNAAFAAADLIQGGQDTGTDVEYILTGVEIA